MESIRPFFFFRGSFGDVFTRLWNLTKPRGIASIVNIARSQRLYENSQVSHIQYTIPKFNIAPEKLPSP